MKNKIPDNIDRIVKCFTEGSEMFSYDGKTVMVFGSAQMNEIDNSHLYNTIRALGAKLAEEGYVVLTGGGPGLMEAANRGAKEAGGRSAGIALEIGTEGLNQYMDEDLIHVSEFFFTRKVLQADISDAFVVVPGGIGTMDELFEILTLMSTNRFEVKPLIVLNHKGYYEPLKHLLDSFVEKGALSPDRRDIVTFVDTIDDVVKLVKKG